MSYRLLSQKNITVLNIGLDVMVNGWLVIILSNKLFSLLDPKVAFQQIIVVSADQLCTNNFRYV